MLGDRGATSDGAYHLPPIRGPVVPIAMATLEDVKTNADLQGVLTREIMDPVSFGGQRSIQLSYGRLSVSIDETQANGNGPDFARLDVGGSLLRQSSGVRIVSGAPIIVCRGRAGKSGQITRLGYACRHLRKVANASAFIH